MIVFGIMVQLYPEALEGPPRYRLHSSIYDTEAEAEAVRDSFRRQNLPFKKTWVFPFEDPRT